MAAIACHTPCKETGVVLICSHCQTLNVVMSPHHFDKGVCVRCNQFIEYPHNVASIKDLVKILMSDWQFERGIKDMVKDAMV